MAASTDTNNSVWACAICTFENQSIRKLCEMCGNRKPGPKIDDDKGWKCILCTVVNPTEAITCQMCGGPNHLINDLTGKQLCGSCTSINLANAHSCSVCGQPLNNQIIQKDDNGELTMVDMNTNKHNNNNNIHQHANPFVDNNDNNNNIHQPSFYNGYNNYYQLQQQPQPQYNNNYPPHSHNTMPPMPPMPPIPPRQYQQYQPQPQPQPQQDDNNAMGSIGGMFGGMGSWFGGNNNNTNNNHESDKTVASMFKDDGYIKDVEELRSIREALVHKYCKFKFSGKKRFDDTKEEKKENQSMFDSVQNMQSLINIKDTDLEQDLLSMERILISNNAKKHISRTCHHSGCKKEAPPNYPSNIYLCDQHKETLSKKLECDIVCNKGLAEEQRRCRELKGDYQRMIQAVKTPDHRQKFNKKGSYPKNYFTAAMAKLLCFQQQINIVDMVIINNVDMKNTINQLKEIGTKLMDLLIASRQNLNDFWDSLFSFILKVIDKLEITVDHIGQFGQFCRKFNNFIFSNQFYIFGVHACCVAMGSAILYFLIYGDYSQKKTAGAAAIGMGIGLALGGPSGGIIGGLIGGGLDAYFG